MFKWLYIFLFLKVKINYLNIVEYFKLSPNLFKIIKQESLTCFKKIL